MVLRPAMIGERATTNPRMTGAGSAEPVPPLELALPVEPDAPVELLDEPIELLDEPIELAPVEDALELALAVLDGAGEAVFEPPHAEASAKEPIQKGHVRRDMAFIPWRSCGCARRRYFDLGAAQSSHLALPP